MRHYLSHPKLPVVLLLGIVVVASLLDWIFGFEKGMVIPLFLELGWRELLSGNFSWEVWQILGTSVSYAFLHGGPTHLLTNAVLFWIFGCIVLEICGWRWLIAIFLVTSVGGAVGHVLLERGSWVPMLGASGAVMGLEGAYLGLVARRKRENPFVWPMARPILPAQLAAVGVLGVFFDLMSLGQESPGASIAYGAHLGGFVTGILMSLIRVESK